MKHHSNAILDLMLSLEDWTWNRDLKDQMLKVDPTITDSQAAAVLERHCHISDFEYRKDKGDDLLDAKKVGKYRYFKTKPEFLKSRAQRP